jgi:hypothetical protein
MSGPEKLDEPSETKLSKDLYGNVILDGRPISDQIFQQLLGAYDQYCANLSLGEFLKRHRHMACVTEAIVEEVAAEIKSKHRDVFVNVDIEIMRAMVRDAWRFKSFAVIKRPPSPGF